MLIKIKNQHYLQLLVDYKNKFIYLIIINNEKLYYQYDINIFLLDLYYVDIFIVLFFIVFCFRIYIIYKIIYYS